MAKRKSDEDDFEDGEGGTATESELVKRELGPQEIEAKKLALADKVIEMLAVKEKRRSSAKKANDKLAELDSEMRELATQARTGVEMVPAQLALPGTRSERVEEAVKARRGVQRGRQDSGAAVEP